MGFVVLFLGGEWFFTDTNVYYFSLENETYSRDESAEYCSGYNASLASVTSYGEHRFLVAHMQRYVKQSFPFTKERLFGSKRNKGL